MRKRCGGFAWGILGLLFQIASAAATVSDSAGVGLNLPNVVSQGGSSAAASCAYNATDTYMGPNRLSGYGGATLNSTETIGSGANPVGQNVSQPAPPLTDASNNLTLTFRGGSWSSSSVYAGTWTSSTPSPLSTPVPCSGTYQVFFSLQVQPTYYSGNQNPPAAAPSITIYPCVQTLDATPTLVYGSLLVGGACPATGPSTVLNPVCNSGNYCSVTTLFFEAQVHLAAGQIVGPPSLHTTQQLVVTGGEFLVYYVGP